MLVKVTFQGRGEDLTPRLDRMSHADQRWVCDLFEKTQEKEPLRMNLDELMRLLTLFNDQERIYFEVR
jgi:hypothetical protein